MEQKENREVPPEGRGVTGCIAVLIAILVGILIIIWL